MREKTKRKILAVELAVLTILSVFVVSILAGRAENKLLNNLAINRNDDTIRSQEDTNPKIIPESQQDSSSDYVFVYFTWSPEYPDVGEKITFRSDGLYFGEYWDFGDGSKGRGSVVTHTYNKKGGYWVYLSAFAWDYYSEGIEFVSATEYIKIGASPFPEFTWSPSEPAPGQSVSFDASESLDTNGQIVSYKWSYTEASEPNNVIDLGNNKTFTYTWDKQGNYNVKLAVTDNDNNTNEITENIIVSILRIEKITSSRRHLVFQITNQGNIAAENIQWKVYVNKSRFMILFPLRKVLYKSGTINTLSPGESTTVDISRYRRAFGRVTITITVGASNAVQITKYLRGFMLGRYILNLRPLSV